jgi:hypothetical protein
MPLRRFADRQGLLRLGSSRSLASLANKVLTGIIQINRLSDRPRMAPAE